MPCIHFDYFVDVSPIPARYVAMTQVAGHRLFCCDQYRNEWTTHLCYAETFRELHRAVQVAERLGGTAIAWQEAQMLA